MMTNNKIADLRKQRGWTQEHLAEVSQVNPRTIQRLEAGEDASLETLRMVANALGVQIGDLFESFSDSNKGKEIEGFDKQKADQTHQWLVLHKFYRLCLIVGFVILMLILISLVSLTDNDRILDITGIAWLILWPIGLGVIKVFQTVWIEPRLSRKYPLAESLNPAYNNDLKGTTKKHSGLWIAGIIILVILMIAIIWAGLNFYLFKLFGI